MASVTGRLYLVTAYLDERQGPMWEATHSHGLKLRKLNRLIQLIESDCSYVFYFMWCFLFTLHDIWLASNECTKMHLVSSWRTSNGQLMGSCSETSQQILCSCDRMCLSDWKGQPSYDWNVLLGSTFFLGFQLSAMNQVTERWEVICSDDDGLTCSGNSSSIRRWEKTNDVMQADLVFV